MKRRQFSVFLRCIILIATVLAIMVFLLEVVPNRDYVEKRELWTVVDERPYTGTNHL